MYRVYWTSIAQKDLELILNYIAQDNLKTAQKLFRSVRRKAASLKRYPKRGRTLPELRHLPGLPFHELIVTPWRLIYRIRGTTVEVLAFLDSRRHLEEILFERLQR